MYVIRKPARLKDVNASVL